MCKLRVAVKLENEVYMILLCVCLQMTCQSLVITSERADQFHQNLTAHSCSQRLYTHASSFAIKWRSWRETQLVSQVWMKYWRLSLPSFTKHFIIMPGMDSSHFTFPPNSAVLHTGKLFWLESRTAFIPAPRTVPGHTTFHSAGLTSGGVYSHKSLRKYQHLDLSTHNINENPPFC